MHTDKRVGEYLGKVLQEATNHFFAFVGQVDVGKVAVTLQADYILHPYHFETFERGQYHLLPFRFRFAEILNDHPVAIEYLAVDYMLLYLVYGNYQFFDA